MSFLPICSNPINSQITTARSFLTTPNLISQQYHLTSINPKSQTTPNHHKKAPQKISTNHNNKTPINHNKQTNINPNLNNPTNNPPPTTPRPNNPTPPNNNKTNSPPQPLNPIYAY